MRIEEAAKRLAAGWEVYQHDPSRIDAKVLEDAAQIGLSMLKRSLGSHIRAKYSGIWYETLDWGYPLLIYEQAGSTWLVAADLCEYDATRWKKICLGGNHDTNDTI